MKQKFRTPFKNGVLRMTFAVHLQIINYIKTIPIAIIIANLITKRNFKAFVNTIKIYKMAYTQQQEEFIDQARIRISNDPSSRLAIPSRTVFERKNFVFDAHCHVFDAGCINAFYLLIRSLSGVPEQHKPRLWKILTGQHMSEELRITSKEELVEAIYFNPQMALDTDDVDALADTMQQNLKQVEIEAMTLKGKLTSVGVGEIIKRYHLILELLRSGTMHGVYAEFEDKYAINHVVNDLYDTDCELITVALGMDLNMGWNGRIKKTQSQQNEELLNLAQIKPILPFLPIDPRRADFPPDHEEGNLYDIFLDAFDKDSPSFFGVKCYPALGYLPSDPRLKPIFQICEEKSIPVMTHCGGESVSTFVKPIVVNRNGISVEINDHSRTTRARQLNEPKEWNDVLTAFNNLRLCFGHFGSGEAWETINNINSTRVPRILDLMKKYNNVYADFSFSLKSANATNRFMEKLHDQGEIGTLMQNRTLFGTDFWVVLPFSNLNADQRNFVEQIGPLKDELLRENVLNCLGLKAFI